MDNLTSDDIARLIALGMLVTVLGSYALIAMRRELGTFLRNALLWVVLFTGVAVSWHVWQDLGPGAQVQTVSTDALELRRARDGHYHLTLEVVGPQGGAPKPVRFIVDTGASEVVLTRADARALGFADDDLSWLGTARTANGLVRTAPVWLDEVRLGALTHRRVRASVNEGEMHVSLLGMGYLERFARIEIARDRLRLEF